MLKVFSTLVRSTWLLVASSVLLITLIGAITACFELEKLTKNDAKAPIVSFAEYEKFTAYVNGDAIDKEKEKFQEKFFEVFPTILKNVSDYAAATNQLAVNPEVFERQLFMVAVEYNHEMGMDYLEQLVDATSELSEYSNELKADNTKKVIDWTEFMNWFNYDFEYQFEENKNYSDINSSKSLVIEISLLTKIIAGGTILIIVVVLIVISLLYKREEKILDDSDESEVTTEELVKEEEVVEVKSEDITEEVSDVQEDVTEESSEIEVADVNNVTVTLIEIGNKTETQKVVREITGLTVKDTKTAMETLPLVIKEGISKDEAIELLKQFENTNSIIEIK
jgi:ribosomal protein L7/L12